MEVGRVAFGDCISLHDITIPPADKTIEGRAFKRSSQLMTAVLGDGLEEIGERAYQECTSLHDITVPPTVNIIRGWAFLSCSQQTTAILGGGI